MIKQEQEGGESDSVVYDTLHFFSSCFLHRVRHEFKATKTTARNQKRQSGREKAAKTLLTLCK